MERIVIIGGGIAGLTAAENIRKGSSEIEITMVCGEEYLPYNRLKLSKYLCRDFDTDDLLIHKYKWYEDNRITVINSAASEIHPDFSKILLTDGSRIDYTELIIANGSSSFIPPFPGAIKDGVFTIRNMKDVLHINEYIRDKNVKSIAIIGGGLLGIEAAWSLRQNSSMFDISIIESLPRLLPRQMDDEGSKVLEGLITNNNIRLYKSLSVKEVHGDKNPTFIELSDSTKVIADMVIISAGVRSNVGLAKDCGINTNRGIIVDSHMRTNYSNIYAAGDTAEYNGAVPGIWPVAMEQGRIAGLNSIKVPEEYKEIVPSNLLQVMDINIFSTGDVNSPSESIKYSSGIYSKIFHNGNILNGAILIGDTKKGLAIKKAIEQKRDFSREIQNGVNLLEIL